MDRLLIVPAAGRGSRLGSTLPKALVRVAGRPMLDHLLSIHGSTVDRTVVVVAPAAVDGFRAFIAERQAPIDIAVQDTPTGMLDAILLAGPLVHRLGPARIAITWCDQIALSPTTIRRVHDRATAPDAPSLVLPTLTVNNPYIHFARDAAGQIRRVLQRREGDPMPAQGETDMGLFDLSRDAYSDELPLFSAQAAADRGTGERNFLPFIPWLAVRRSVETVNGLSRIETVGVNTPEELSAIETHLASNPRLHS